MKNNIYKGRIRTLNIFMNMMFIILCLISYSTSYKILTYSIFAMYIIYIIFLDIENILYNQVILSIMLTSTYDIIWRKTIINIPMECKYVVDLLSIVLILKIIVNYSNHRNAII